ncbi:MAG: type II secretion system protein [Gammaproteobacteria bacterium]|nr:type II secretion system protein [Gammaproteobacteria bacterium]
MARRSNGFTLLELVVVIALISVLLTVAVARLAGYVREAERVAVLSLEGQLRNALTLETARRILNDDDAGLLALEHSNPMRLVLEAPYNYAGELPPQDHYLVEPRHWFFDLGEHELVYRRSATAGNSKTGHDIRYRVKVAYNDRDGDGRFAVASDELLGVRLLRQAD